MPFIECNPFAAIQPSSHATVLVRSFQTHSAANNFVCIIQALKNDKDNFSGKYVNNANYATIKGKKGLLQMRPLRLN